MFGVFAVLTLITGILIFVLALLASRNPDGPTWIHKSLVSDFIAIGCVGMCIIGLGLTVQFALNYSVEANGLLPLSLVLVEVSVFLLLLKRLRVRERLARYEQTAAATAGGHALPPSPAPRKRAA